MNQPSSGSWNVYAPFVRCMSLLLADFVAEVGAERMITLTLHTPNEAAALVHGH